MIGSRLGRWQLLWGAVSGAYRDRLGLQRLSPAVSDGWALVCCVPRLGCEWIVGLDDREWTREVAVALGCGFRGLKGPAEPTEALASCWQWMGAGVLCTRWMFRLAFPWSGSAFFGRGDCIITMGCSLDHYVDDLISQSIN
jgi:hypothetical protein